MPPKEEIIIRSRTLKMSLDLAQKIGKNRERISFGNIQSVGENEFSVEVAGGTIEDVREMFRGIPSLEVIGKKEIEIDINLDSFLPPDSAEQKEK